MIPTEKVFKPITAEEFNSGGSNPGGFGSRIGEFNPDSQSANTFNTMFGPAEIRFGQSGNSHLGYVNPLNANYREDGLSGFHVTTQVPKMKQDFPVSIHDEIKW